MKRKTENKVNSQSEFLRYRQSDMNGPESNAFEKELEKDPFASEAAEGFELAGPEEIKNDLADLGTRLRKRTEIKKRLPYY